MWNYIEGIRLIDIYLSTCGIFFAAPLCLGKVIVGKTCVFLLPFRNAVVSNVIKKYSKLVKDNIRYSSMLSVVLFFTFLLFQKWISNLLLWNKILINIPFCLFKRTPEMYFLTFFYPFCFRFSFIFVILLISASLIKIIKFDS